HLFERGPLLEHGHILGHEPSRHQASLGRRADGSGARPHLPSQAPPLDVAVSGTTTLVPSAVMRTPSGTTSAWLTAIPAGRPSTGISIAVTRSRSTPGSDSGVICLPPRVRFCASTSSLPVSTRGARVRTIGSPRTFPDALTVEPSTASCTVRPVRSL